MKYIWATIILVVLIEMKAIDSYNDRDKEFYLKSSRRGKSRSAGTMYFCVIYFDLSFQNYFQNSARTKQFPQNWILLVKSSSTGVSGTSEVPRFVGKLIFIGNQDDVFVLNNRVD